MKNTRILRGFVPIVVLALTSSPVRVNDDTANIASTLCAALDCPTCVVFVRAIYADNTVSQGTGVLLENGNVLTTRHVIVDEWENQPNRIEVFFGGRNDHPKTDGLAGRGYALRITGKEGDLAVITGCEVPAWAVGAHCSRNALKLGDRLVSVGLEHLDSVRLHSAKISELDRQKPHALIKVQSQKGNSGGPVFEKNGQLVGIVSALESYVRVRIEAGSQGQVQFVHTTVKPVAATCVIELRRVAESDPEIAKLVGL